MTYIESYRQLNNVFNQEEPVIPIGNSSIAIHNCRFESNNTDVLPGRNSYTCRRHGDQFTAEFKPGPAGDYHSSLAEPDCEFECNSTFTYSVFKPQNQLKSDGYILLFHGLNEKHWHKYLPWAHKLCRQTGKAIILFPIAFHMNRAPRVWSHPAEMQSVSIERQKRYPTIVQSSFANAAISVRLEASPQRFFWSGLQTYYDIIQLVQQIKNGEHPLINSKATVDFFSYSIGSFLAQIMLMTNSFNLFDKSRMFIFCGGPTLDRMNPVSRYILDSKALVSLYSFYIQHLQSEFEKDERLHHYFKKGHASGGFFELMLNYHNDSKRRENRLNELNNRINALVLKQDTVIPPFETVNTLKGNFRDIPINVTIEDFPYSYNHVNPFPVRAQKSAEVEEAFSNTFDMVGEFLA